MTFGAVVRQFREELGFSQAEVARRAGIDEQSRVSEIEREKSEPSISRARQVARGMGILLTELVARWEDVELVWVKAERKAIAEAKGATNETDLTERGGTMDDLGQILMKVLDSVPAERKEDFVSHCTNFGMHLRRGRDHVATGTDPKD
jgi:transcriptional regulator with XRE-family HTH domain